MTLQTDSEFQTVRPNGIGRQPGASQRSLTQALSQVGEILKEQLDRAQSSAKPWADNTGRSLVDLSRQTTAQIRKRPIATAAAVVGLGVGLAFLLSGRARAGVANVGSQAVNTYKRYRR